MVKIRLMRVGKTKQPSYRVVVADSRSPRDGRIIEAIGHYHPRQDPSEIVIKSDRAVYWLGKGAQPSNTVKNLMRISGAWAEFTGETPPAPPTQQEVRKRATAAASVTETDEAPEAGEKPAEVPEATDQADAAPEADDTDSDSGDSDSGDSDSSDSDSSDSSSDSEGDAKS